MFAVLLKMPPCARPFVKVGGTCPRAMESAPLPTSKYMLLRVNNVRTG